MYTYIYIYIYIYESVGAGGWGDRTTQGPEKRAAGHEVIGTGYSSKGGAVGGGCSGLG